MKIVRLIGGNLESNGFIIYNKEGSTCYIIDPGYQPEKYIKKVNELGLKPEGILLTHHHYDHVGGINKIHETYDCPIFIHRADSDCIRGHVTPIDDGKEFMLEDEKITTIHTPGHTRGGVCYYSEKSKVCFTGDTIFNVDLGRTDLEDGSQRDMEASIKNIIDKWSNEITIYPGHGDQCNMKYVRKNNREFLDIVE